MDEQSNVTPVTTDEKSTKGQKAWNAKQAYWGFLADTFTADGFADRIAEKLNATVEALGTDDSVEAADIRAAANAGICALLAVKVTTQSILDRVPRTWKPTGKRARGTAAKAAVEVTVGGKCRFTVKGQEYYIDAMEEDEAEKLADEFEVIGCRKDAKSGKVTEWRIKHADGLKLLVKAGMLEGV
jgi:hypothetical protein